MNSAVGEKDKQYQQLFIYSSLRKD